MTDGAPTIHTRAHSSNGSGPRPKRPEKPQRIGRFSGVEQMSVDDWISVPTNPRQRDTERRAAQADHLHQPSAAHGRVAMAVLPNGDRYKLDGHTRAHLWHLRQIEEPSIVFADVYRCRDLAEVVSLFDHFDNRKAVETSADAVFGGYRQHGLDLRNPFLRSGKIAAALNHASLRLLGSHRPKDLHDIVLLFKPELRLLDKTDATPRWFTSGILAGAIITLIVDPVRALAFWSDYAGGFGTKVDGEMDAVEALRDRVQRGRMPSGYSPQKIQTPDQVGYAIAGFRASQDGRTYATRASLPIAAPNIVQRTLKTARERLDARADTARGEGGQTP